MFGSTQKPLFGSSTSSGFGSGGGGLFGSSAGTGGFGTPATPFGSSTPAAGGTSIFGNTSQPSGGGLFGTSTTTPFGQTAANTTGSTGFSFGGTSQPASGGLFGQTSSTQSTSLFGNTTFGGTSASGGLFGGASATSFGTPAASTGTGLFGGGFGATTPAQNGTTIKFAAPSGSDTMVKNGTPHNINTRHQCITAMKEYENKSLEELRVEDYLANRKGPQAGSTAAGGLFGATAQPAASTTTPFGAFGATQNKPAGFSFGNAASSGGLFGSTQTPATQTGAGGLFGQQNKSLFGSTATTTTASSLFGGGGTSSGFGFGTQSTATKSLFGAPASTQSTSLFGSTPAASSSGFSFGNTAGQQTSSLFGNKTSTPFGAPAASSGGLTFGQPSTSSSLFGKPATSSAFGFGAPSTGSTFGQTSSSSLFGAKPALGASTGFGTSTGFGLGTSSLGGGSSLFSNTASKPGFGFGTTTATPAGGLGTGLGLGTGTSSFGFGTSAQPALGQPSAEAAQQQNLLQQQLQALVQSPYGDSPLFRNLKNDEKREEILRPTNPSAQKASLSESSLKIGQGSANRIKPRPLHPLVGGKAHLFDGLDETDSLYGAPGETFVSRKSVKKLVIRPSVPVHPQPAPSGPVHPHPALSDTRRSPLNRTESNNQRSGRADRSQSDANASHDVITVDDQNDVIRRSIPLNGSPATPGDRLGQNLDNTMSHMFSDSRGQSQGGGYAPSQAQPGGGGAAPGNRLKLQSSTATDTSHLDSEDEDDADDDGRETPPLHPAGITLRRHGYYTIPSLDELRDAVDEHRNCFVEDLTIGREGYGSVFFPGVTNLAGMNLDEIVHFRRKEITVYPDDDRKPPIGDGLNKKAEVTLDCVWPNDKTTQSPIKSVDRLKAMNYTSKIESATAKIGAKFIDYRPETGSWVFEVKHFSKYGLLDDSDDESAGSQFPERDPKKLKTLMEKSQEQQLIQRQHIAEKDGAQPPAPQQPAQPLVNGESRDEDHVTDKSGGDGRRGLVVDEDADMIADMPEKVDMEEELMGDFPEQVASSHRLATELGVNPHSMQVMKASFFGENDIDLEIAHSTPFPTAHVGRTRPRTPIYDILDGRKVLDGRRTPLDGRRTPSGLLQTRLQAEPRARDQRPKSFTSGLLSQKAHAPSPQLAEEMVRRPEFHQHPVTITDICHTHVPNNRSYLHQKHNLVMDAACYRNRAHRVGWGRNLTMVHTLRMDNKDSRRRGLGLVPSSTLHGTVQSLPSLYQAHINTVHVTNTSLDKTMLTSVLEVALSNCEEQTTNLVPKLVPRSGVDGLHRLAQTFREQLNTTDCVDEFTRVSSRALELCVALWGHMPGYDDDVDESSYEYHIGRREAFQHWLTTTVRHEAGEAPLQEEYLGRVVRCLCGDQVSEASELAAGHGDFHLALLLAQVQSGQIVRDMIQKQLDNWKENQADEFMEPSRLKVYAILAGLPVWRSTSLSINTCEDLSWKQALALHLLYHGQPNASISTAFDDFVSAFKGRGPLSAYCAPPLPDYLEGEELGVRDTCYHLIKLYTKRSHRLETTLAPATSTADHLDYRLSWHLYQVMASVGYSHLSSQNVCHLHTSYAAQLEAAGLWYWAVCVLLHLDDPLSRESSIRDLLMRHVHEADDDVIEFLTDKLRIPPLWIHHAKAVHAGWTGRHGDEAWHLLQAGMINRCHQVVLQHLAADAIINERYGSLMRYLEGLARHQTRIHNWSSRGGVYYDFIRLNQDIQLLKKGSPSLYDLERLQPDVLSLTQRVSSLHCRSARDRLCQSEIAQRSASLLQMLASFQPTKLGDLVQTQIPVGVVAPHISNLPMPEDYSLKLLRRMTEAYIADITS